MISRSTVEASNFAISSGHPLASEAGMAMLEAGGNAVDAGVAAGRVITIDGLGTWPEKASVDFFDREFDGQIPEGILRTVVPAAPAAWLTCLKDFGTLRFADVAEPAIRYARDGFSVYPLFAEIIDSNEARYRADTETARIYLPYGKPPNVGDQFIQADLARTLQYMVDEESASRGDRVAGLNAAYDAFYSGDIAKTICDYHRQHNGFLTQADMSNYRVRYESPMNTNFGDCDVYTCGAWCQGISLAQAFAMLDADRLRSLKHNSADYIHHLVETYKLVFADRECFVADPAFTDVPANAMLDKSYLTRRLALINPDHAFSDMPAAGDPRRGDAILRQSIHHQSAPRADDSPIRADAHATVPHDSHTNAMPGDLDTSHVGVVDQAGNMFVSTPSDTSSDTVVIPGTGLCPSSRGSQSRGIQGHINAVAPGKRPRLTPNPALVLKNNKPFMTLGTPGGDVQIQAMTQVLANILCHGLDVQAAIEAPRFASYSFPSSFAPNASFPGLLMVEPGIDESTIAKLVRQGHNVERWADYTWKAGGVCAIVVDDKAPSRLRAGADPRRANMAMGQ